MTPAEAAGINVKGWRKLIENAQIQKTEGKIGDKQVIEVMVKA